MDIHISHDSVIRSLISEQGIILLDNNFLDNSFEQLSLFPQDKVTNQDIFKNITGQL